MQSLAALNGREILLGVTGGIAAYKAADLASKLVQAGAPMPPWEDALSRYLSRLPA